MVDSLRTSGHDPPANRCGRQSVHARSLRVATRGFARPWDCTDGIRLEDGNEHHETDRSDDEREETQDFFHILAPMHFPFLAERANRQLTNLFAIWG